MLIKTILCRLTRYSLVIGTDADAIDTHILNL